MFCGVLRLHMAPSVYLDAGSLVLICLDRFSKSVNIKYVLSCL